MRQRAALRVKDEAPPVLMVTGVCTRWDQVMSFNVKNMANV